jgi:hypothetical protein
MVAVLIADDAIAHGAAHAVADHGIEADIGRGGGLSHCRRLQRRERRIDGTGDGRRAPGLLLDVLHEAAQHIEWHAWRILEDDHASARARERRDRPLEASAPELARRGAAFRPLLSIACDENLVRARARRHDERGSKRRNAIDCAATPCLTLRILPGKLGVDDDDLRDRTCCLCEGDQPPAAAMGDRIECREPLRSV